MGKGNVMRRPSQNALQLTIPVEDAAAASDLAAAIVQAPPPPPPPPRQGGPSLVRPKATPKKRFTEVTRIRYASDFCGMGTLSIALKEALKGIPDIDTEHAFACDNNKNCRDMTSYIEQPKILDGDILSRNIGALPKAVSLYSLTAPCQGLSPAGNGLGIRDPRTKLLLKGVEVIEQKLPKAFILENSSALAQFAKHAPFYRTLKKRLAVAGRRSGLSYLIFDKVLNSKVYVPQNRARTYMVGIRSDAYRKSGAKGIEVFPNPPPNRLFTLKDVVMPLTSGFQWLPANPAKSQRVLKAIRESGVDAVAHPIIVDVAASDKFSTYRIGEVPAITKSRGSAKDAYWCTTKGGHLSATELAMLQGFPREHIGGIKMELHKSDSIIGGCVGNAQTVPLLADLAAHVLYMSKSITKDQFIMMKLNIGRMKPFQ